MKINIKGPIVPSNQQMYYDSYNIDATSPKKVEEQLKKANGADVELYINSNGGSVFAGSEIYTLLKEYKGKITAKIVGLAESPALFSAMAADRVFIAPLAQIKVHQAKTSTDGNSDAHISSYEMLKGIDRAVADVYRKKTGISQEELLNLMKKTTWMNADKAVELKFADEIMFDTEEDSDMSEITYKSNELPKNLVNILMELDKQQEPMNSITRNEKRGNASLKNSKKKGEWFMNVADLQKKQPELYNEIIQLGMNQERKRVNDLRSMQDQVDNPKIIEDAIQNGTPAGEVAQMIVKNWADRPDYEGEANAILNEIQNVMNENRKGDRG